MRKGFYNLKVAFVSKEKSTIQIGLTIPEKHTKDFIFLPGQYLTFIVTIDGKDYRRAYSICSSSHTKSKLSVLIKRLDGGLVSNFLNDNVQPGDIMTVLAPMGSFKIALENSIPKSYYFIGAGSGITPLLSMITSILDEESNNTCHLLYGNTNENNIIFKAQLNRLALVYQDRLTIDYVLSRPLKSKKSHLFSFFKNKKTTWQGYTGRINQTIISSFLDKRKNTQTKEYYICGPGDMIESSVNSLHSLDIDPLSIHREYFTSADPKLVVETNTKIDATKILNKAIVTLDGVTTEVFIQENSTIVDALLHKGIEPPYSCLSGSCSSCKAKITKGKVAMDVSIGLEDGEEEKGYILTCQSHPITESISINYDTI